MFDFNKEHEYLVCIDSDGTVMDTMTIKHERAFGPAFIITYGINEHVDEILNEWNRVNLYARTRGINRFVGLKNIIEFVKKEYGYIFDGSQEFFKWVDTTNELSMRSLKKYFNECENVLGLEKAYAWSTNVNKIINTLPETNAFNGVSEALFVLKDKVDLLGVSSANKEAVEEEWKRLGFYSYFKEVACQDKGTKKEIIANGLKCGYQENKTIMLGDAVGDLEAAKKNNIWFFPIIPTKEGECWKRFVNEGVEKLINNEFNQQYQDLLIKEFLDFLK